MNVKILTLVIVLLVSLLCSASAGEYMRGQPCRSSSPSASLFLSLFAILLVQAAVVDQLPSVVSLVWAPKGRNISTCLCTVLHCSGYTVCYCTAMAFIVNLIVHSGLDWLFSSLPHLDVCF